MSNERWMDKEVVYPVEGNNVQVWTIYIRDKVLEDVPQIINKQQQQ